MNILCIGDVCGSAGCTALLRRLPELKREYGIDLTVVNGENSADSNGITVDSAKTLFAAGADVITGGNHTLRRREVFDMIENDPFMLRPDNLSDNAPGDGYCLFDAGRYRIAIINIIGTMYLEKLSAKNPFQTADKLLNRASFDGADITVCDFHAEATSEKRALGLYLDGSVSVFFGTHTHIQTADEQILKCGTGYITDIGMTGPKDSVLGVKTDIIIDRLKNGGTQKFELANSPCIINGCVFTVDEKTGKTVKIKRIYFEE